MRIRPAEPGKVSCSLTLWKELNGDPAPIDHPAPTTETNLRIMFEFIAKLIAEE